MVDVLAAEEGEEEVEVDGHGDELGVDEGQGHPRVGDQAVVARGHVREVLGEDRHHDGRNGED